PFISTANPESNIIPPKDDASLIDSTNDSSNELNITKLNILPNSAYLKKGKRRRFKIDLGELKTIASQRGIKSKKLKKTFKWMVNEIPGGNRKIGRINKRGIYKAPKKIPGKKKISVDVSAYSEEAGISTKKARILVLKRIKKGKLYIKAKWITKKGNKRAAEGGIPNEVKIVRGRAYNETLDIYIPSPPDWVEANMQERRLVFPDVPDGVYRVVLQGVNDSGKVIYQGQVEDVEPVLPEDKNPEPVIIILTSVDEEVKISEISPQISEMLEGESQQFSVTVTGAIDPPDGNPVEWKVVGGDSHGVCSKSGMFTAPSNLSTPITTTLRAVSKADPSVSAELTFRIMPNISISITPKSVSMDSQGTVQFTTIITGSTDKSVIWKASAGVINSSGLYQAPAVLTTTIVTVTAVSNANPTKSASATVTINPVISVSVSPSSITLDSGGSQQFTATVLGAEDTSVSWSIVSGVGNISPTGLYTAPNVSSQSTVTVRAVSNQDSSKSDTATITINPVVVSVSPGSAVIDSGGSYQFTALVTGASDSTVSWSVDGGSSNGTVDSSGLYTAPTVLTQTLVTVRAVSNQNSVVSDTAQVTINAASVSVSPASATVDSGATLQFTATVTGHIDTSVTWSVISGSGSIDSLGLYTAPLVLTQTVETIKAVSNGDPTKYDTATVTVNPVITVTVSPSTATVYSNGSKQFNAIVTGAQDTSVTWSVITGTGTISPSGLYTAPSVLTQTVETIKAVSNQDNTKFDTATITVNPFVTVSVSPSETSVDSAGVITFTATVSGTLDTSVTWSVDGGSANGTITTQGIYTAPSVLTTTVVTVTATSNADPSVSDSAIVTVIPVVQGFKIYPTISHIQINKTQKYSVVITGAADKTADWYVNNILGGNSTFGTIDANGVYTAPASLPSPVTVTIKAVSLADSSFNSTAVVALRGKGSFWAKTYDAGNNLADKAEDIEMTTDGGFIVAGYTVLSTPSPNKDFWLLKLDTEGEVVWQKRYGGGGDFDEYAESVEQTSDGGYIVAGTTTEGAAQTNWLILKLDADGNIQWKKYFGTPYGDYAHSVEQTSDGGYIVAGSVYTPTYANDAFLLKLDSKGNIQWSKRYGDGASGFETAYAVEQTSDGGYIVGGDAWNKALIMKVDSAGTVLWSKEFSAYKFYSVEETSDGGYVAVGGNPGSVSYGFMVKMYSDGTVAWQREYGIGSSSGENFYSVEETSDGGFIVSGFSDESNIDWKHLWALKLNSIGDIMWQKVYYVDSLYDFNATSAVEIPSEGFAIAGYLASSSINISDLWVLKVDPTGNIGTTIYGGGGGGSFGNGVFGNSGFNPSQFNMGGCTIVHKTSVTPSYSSYTTTSTLGGYTYFGTYSDSALNISVTSPTIASQCSSYDIVGPVVSYTIPANNATNVNINAVIAVKFSEPVDPSTVNSSNITLSDGNGSVSGTVAYEAEQMTAYFTPTSPLSYNSVYSLNVSSSIADLSGNLSTVYTSSFTTQPAPPLAGFVKVFGGLATENFYCVKKLSDNGYIMGGQEGNGYPWIVRLDSSGTVSWGKTYGTENGIIKYIEETIDGGFIAGGEMSSLSGAGFSDIFIMKISSFGAVSWAKLIGTANVDLFSSLHQTSDGGYIVAGHTTGFFGSSDIWVIKLNASGTIVWQKVFGGADVDFSSYIVENGLFYILAGETQSFGSGVGSTTDLLILKLDSSGNIVSQNTYGVFGWQRVNALVTTSDGGYILAGYTTNPVPAPLIIKFNSSDLIDWQKLYDGGNYDEIQSIVQTSDGGYAVTGSSSDIYIMKLFADGTIDWQKTYGGSSAENGNFIVQATDGGYAVAGSTYSFGFGNSDGLLIKTDSQGYIGGTCSIGGDIIGTGTATATDTAFTASSVSVSTSNTSVTPIDISSITTASYTSNSEYCSVYGSPALSVYLMSSGNAVTDDTISNTLSARGHTVTIGVEPQVWDGTQATLSNYDVVVMANSYNWNSGSMSAKGAHALRRYIRKGGGLVTSEWTIRNIDLEGRHRELEPVVPADATSYNTYAATQISLTSDAIIMNGMTTSFNINYNNISGSESILAKKTGATAYFINNAGGDALVGWNYGAGRVLSFSTLITDVELANSNYRQLFINAVERAGKKTQ
ncbi:MAG: hypothetical protein D6732_29330, partial [Methanobacteriota archaeon]